MYGWQVTTLKVPQMRFDSLLNIFISALALLSQKVAG